jgi:hypothetical protein
MTIDLFNKIFLFLFFLSSLNVIRVSYFLIQKWIDNEKFKLGEKSLFLLGISISYILLCIFSGINL